MAGAGAMRGHLEGSNPLWIRASLCLVALAGALWLGLARAQQPRPGPDLSVFPDPGLTQPRFRFHTGRKANGAPELSAILPNIPGPTSKWTLTQWAHTKPLHPDQMTTDGPRTEDPRLGRSTYAFTSPHDKSHLWIYRNPQDGHYVYELYERDGRLQGGGKNLFLSAKASQPNATLDRVIAYDLKAKLSRARIAYWTNSAATSGAVQASVFSGFVLEYTGPSEPGTIVLFLQIPLAGSRDPRSSYRSCQQQGRGMVITANQSLPGDALLPFRPDPGPPRSLHYVLNQYLCSVLSQPMPCTRPGGRAMVDFTTTARDFSKWDLKSMYIGLETQATDLRPTAQIRGQQGTTAAGLQISDLRVVRYDNEPFTRSDCGR